MKTWTERLPEIIAFIESGNGIAKHKAKKELGRMADLADENEKLASKTGMGLSLHQFYIDDAKKRK